MSYHLVSFLWTCHFYFTFKRLMGRRFHLENTPNKKNIRGDISRWCSLGRFSPPPLIAAGGKKVSLLQSLCHYRLFLASVPFGERFLEVDRLKGGLKGSNKGGMLRMWEEEELGEEGVLQKWKMKVRRKTKKKKIKREGLWSHCLYNVLWPCVIINLRGMKKEGRRVERVIYRRKKIH